jgi:hypothetical protein
LDGVVVVSFLLLLIGVEGSDLNDSARRAKGVDGGEFILSFDILLSCENAGSAVESNSTVDVSAFKGCDCGGVDGVGVLFTLGDDAVGILYDASGIGCTLGTAVGFL